MNETEHKLQSLLDAQIGKGHVRNVVAAVQSHDRSLDFLGAAGLADTGTGAAMTPETPFFIASVTKMVTAAVVLGLVQEQRIDLDAPMVDYLPSALVRGIHRCKGEDFSERIRVLQLLNQTSGLADHETGRPRGGRSVLDQLKAGQDRAVETEEVVEILRRLPARFAPGTPGKAHYSNANYRLLGAIVEKVTATSMARVFEERVFGPLGLRHTYLFDGRPRDRAPATIYLKSRPAHVPRYLASNVSDGGLVSTASECVVFLRAFFEGRLFDRVLLERMTVWNPIFFPLSYGWGLMRFQLPRFFWPRPLPEFIGHSGSTGSFAFTCPSQSLYLAGTVNRIAPARPFFLMIRLVRSVR